MGRGGQGVERGGGSVGQACQRLGEQITENSLSFSFQSGIVVDSHLSCDINILGEAGCLAHRRMLSSFCRRFAKH